MRVNQDPDDGQNDQWLPWITWDDCTGALAVVFLDSRDFLTKANTYVAVSYNEGATWSETKVSDVSWEGDVSPGGFAGDYIGIDARGGIAYPVWSDDRDTNDGTTFKVYTSPIYLWGIVQSSPTVTVSQSCPGRLRFDVQWDTTMPTDGLDRVEVYAARPKQLISEYFMIWSPSPCVRKFQVRFPPAIAWEENTFSF